MTRLGLRLTLRSGREALIRLVITVLAVAVGVTVLLGVLAYFQAFQTTSKRPSWESTTGTQVSQPLPNDPNATLWNYSENLYKGQFIEELDVAALGAKAPVVPGIPRLPGAGQFYASPALAALLRTVPRDELGDRFPGSQVGTIGEAALSGPSELVIIAGHTPSELAALPNTVQVDRIATAPQTQGTTNIYRLLFGVVAIALMFPLLILINTATRLAAARREERYAAMRLVGATPHQVGVIASVDAVVGALLGTVLGIGIFLLARPALATIALSGARFFPQTVTPPAWAYPAMLVGIPLAAALASRVSLRRVQISPLGVSRKVTPPAPRVWRVLPLLVGIPLFVYPVVSNVKQPGTRPIFLGLILILLGLVLAGSWLTMQVARLLAKVACGASSLLAARRLADNPKGSFRTVSGLVLAVFVGTAVAVLAPALNAAQSPPGDASLTNVLRVPYTRPGLPPQTAATLIAALEKYPGVTVIPIYTNPAFSAFQSAQAANGPPAGAPGTPKQIEPKSGPPPDDSVLACASLAQLPVLGSCAPGLQAVDVNSGDVLFTDNPLFVTKSLPLVTHGNASQTADVGGLTVQALLVKTTNTDSLEKARTYLTAFNATIGSGSDLTAWQMGDLEPETFGEVAAIRNNDDTNIEHVILAMLGLTLLIAGCSLAVTVGGSLVERKRQFTLLRLSGTPRISLNKVVLMESVLPLVTASLVAAATGFGVAIPVVKSVLPKVAQTIYPSPIYYLIMAAGLAVSLLVVLATLPLLGRITSPDNVRFE
jgi:hypothetical protein